MRKSGTDFRARSAARIVAVQALYQMEMSGASAEEALIDQAGREPDPESVGTLVEPDSRFLSEIVRGAAERHGDLDGMIGAALSKDWPLERLEAVLRAILRAGAWELLSRLDIDAPVIITEYVRIAEAFFDGGEPKLANGVLDNLATTLRNRESAVTAPDE